MFSLLFDIALPAHEYLRVYQGVAKRVVVKSHDGRTVNIAARHFQPFLTHAGIYSCFVLEFNAQGQLLTLRQLS